MKFLVTGGTGQLGQALRATIDRDDHEAIFTVRDETGDEAHSRLDLAEPQTIRRAVQETEPDWIVHTAAMTDVDRCEREPEAAHEVNEEGAKHLAEAADDVGARLLYVSTDYVFDGERGPYTEDDEPDPINAYGRSKLAGERRVEEIHEKPLIARTCVIFGPHRPNFVTWVIDRLRNGEPVPAIEDQSVTPTYSLALAEELLTLVESDEDGVRHTAGPDELTRLEMAHAIADTLDLDASLIEPTKRSELGWDAPRPRRAGLISQRADLSLDPMPLSKAIHDLDKRRNTR